MFKAAICNILAPITAQFQSHFNSHEFARVGLKNVVKTALAHLAQSLIMDHNIKQRLYFTSPI